MERRPSIRTLIQLAIGLAALAWAARGVSLEGLGAVWSAANPGLLAAAVAIALLCPVLQGVRLRRLLLARGVALGLGLGESIRLAFAGNFMNFALPIGSTTGDVFKAAYLSQRTNEPWEAAVTTFVDRGLGFATLLVTVSLVSLTSDPGSPLAALRNTLLGLSLALVLGLCALRWLPLSELGRLHRLPAGAKIARIAEILQGSLASPRVLGFAVLDTIGIQVAAAASFLCSALALGFVVLPADWSAFYAFFSAGEMVRALPGPPQGLGALESAYQIFFRDWATPAEIVSAAAAVRAVQLVSALPGASVAMASIPYLRRRRGFGASGAPASAIAPVPLPPATSSIDPSTHASGKVPTMTTRPFKPTVSVFFPCYNEEANVERTTLAAVKACERLFEDYEVIIVDDGSRDRTGEIADRLAAALPKVRAVHNNPNRGYGGALRRGFAEARMPYIFYTDGDGQFDFEEMERLLPLMQQYDIVSGYRMNRQDPLHRRINAACWGKLVDLLFGLRVKDVDCAFKMFPRRLFEQIELHSNGALIDTEVLARARGLGYSVGQIGVRHFPRTAGVQTGANLRVILHAFRELFALHATIRATPSKTATVAGH